MARVSLAQVEAPMVSAVQAITAPAAAAIQRPVLAIHDPANHAAGSAQPNRLSAQPGPPEHEVCCPISGELIPASDVDGLIDCLERVKALNATLYPVELEIRQLLAAQTTGDQKTRRVRGHRRIAKVEMPDDSWDQPALRNIWAEFEFAKFREEYLRLGTIDVKKVEYKKLVNMTGPVEFERFRDLLTAANRGQTGTPKVTVEK